MKLRYALALSALAVAGCDKPSEPSTPAQTSTAPAQCFKDTDCKGDRICDDGKCTSPQASPTLAAKPQPISPPAPTMTYQVLAVGGDEIGGVFSLENREMGGTAINYVSRAGVVNVMEFVVEDVDLTTYVAVEKAYAFGGKYLLVVSTGESGRSCPATTYAFTYDTASESVTGKTQIDGCSEMVEALADGNKLTVKKEGASSVFYNGEVK